MLRMGIEVIMGKDLEAEGKAAALEGTEFGGIGT